MAFNLSTQGHIAVFYDDEELGLQQKFIGKGTIVTTITGMKYRPNYESTLKNLDIDVVVVAKPEPNNPYDANAIAIYYKHEIIGYVPKKDVPFIMPNVDDNGTECVIDTMDDGYVGIKLKVSFKHLGKRPQNDLPALNFLDSECLMTEAEFTKKYLKKKSVFTSTEQEKPKQEKTKQKQTKLEDLKQENLIKDITENIDYSFELELELGSARTRSTVESMIKSAIKNGKKVYFENALIDDEIVMIGYGVDMKFPIDNENINEAVENGQKVRIIPNLSIKTNRKSSINTETFVYKKTYNPFKDESLKILKKMSKTEIVFSDKWSYKYTKCLKTELSNGIERILEAYYDCCFMSTLYDIQKNIDTDILVLDDELESLAKKGYKVWAKITNIREIGNGIDDFYVDLEFIVTE